MRGISRPHVFILIFSVRMLVAVGVAAFSYFSSFYHYHVILSSLKAFYG